jgi:hypothetical protein
MFTNTFSAPDRCCWLAPAWLSLLSSFTSCCAFDHCGVG